MKKRSMLNKEKDSQRIKDYISKISTPIFDKVLNETNSNSMAIAIDRYQVAWRPNGYRRQIIVKTKSDSTIKLIKCAIGKNCSVGKRNKLVFVTDYLGNTIQYGKNVLTVIYPPKIIYGNKQIYHIEDESKAKTDLWINNKKEEIEASLDNSLFKFAKQFNIFVRGVKPVWTRHEDWTRDKNIDKLPKECIVHMDNFKKVYGEGVEFTGGKNEEPVSDLINYIDNARLKNYTPEIVEEINKLHEIIDIKFNGLDYIKSYAKNINDIIRFKEIIIYLSSVDKFKLEEWIFYKFGVGCYE